MWKIYSASAQGETYFNEGKNNQDAFNTYSDEEMAISFICDGCHNGTSSEVVSRLSAPFLVRTTRSLLKDGVPIELIPELLFENYLVYLEFLVQVQQFQTKKEIEIFIRDFLLCTVIGVIAYKGKVLLLNCGDGSFYLNNSVYIIRTSENNRPTYPAYNLYKIYSIVGPGTKELASDDGKKTKIPDGFETVVLSAEEVIVIGIASDGLNPYPNLLDELKAHAYSQISLTLCLNRIVVIREETTDNVTVSFLVRSGGIDG